MTATQFLLGAVRLALILVPLLSLAHRLRRRLVPDAHRALGVLAECVMAVSLLTVGAELLGLAGLLGAFALGALFAAGWVAAHLSLGADRTRAPRPGRTASHATSVTTVCATVAALIVVAPQWLLGTANSLGSGMLNFDTLWYHMPFAAGFAQTGSVTGIHFTQADPITAYYPANSELVHAVGITALHGDFLSPLMSLLWLAIGLLGAWCLGLRWRVAPQTLAAGCLVFGLPVLSATQPGEAFNDIAGLAMLLAGLALIVSAEGGLRAQFAGGLAVGFALGTKYTFLVPAAVVLVAVPLFAERGRRLRHLGAIAAAIGLTGGWWYLRNLIDVGNPLGLRVHLGPLALPGPRSPVADSLQQTVLSELEHTALWGSRFAPGLAHALGPLWPLLLATYLVVVVLALRVGSDWRIRTLALCAVAGGAAYLIFPTGATALQQGTSLFEVNLRYATPAIAIAILLLPVVVRERAPACLGVLAPAMLVVLLAAQFEHQLWPTQPTRHVAFLAGTAVAAAATWAILRWAPRARLTKHRLALLGLVATIAAGGAAYGAERHYFDRRYLAGGTPIPGAAALYRWAQHLGGRSPVALYGLLTQYPLSGAHSDVRVDYLGEHTPGGGYGPISSCELWRQTIDRGHYRWLVLSPAPTGTIPVSWSAHDPAAHLVLHPTPAIWVFALSGPLRPAGCGA